MSPTNGFVSSTPSGRMSNPSFPAAMYTSSLRSYTPARGLFRCPGLPSWWEEQAGRRCAGPYALAMATSPSFAP